MIVFPAFQMLVGILDHDDGRIDHRADGDGDAAQREDIGVQSLHAHRDEGDEDTERQRENGNQRRTDGPEEQRADERHDDELLDQLGGQIVDRAIDQARPVIGGDDLHAGWQALLQFLEPSAYPVDHLARVLALAHHDDTACNLALAV